MESDGTDEVVRAFVERSPAPGHPVLGVQAGALMVDSWWAAALWLGRRTCIVRLDDGPAPGLADRLAPALAAEGLAPQLADLGAPVESISAQRLGVVGAIWQVWADGEETALADIAAGLG